MVDEDGAPGTERGGPLGARGRHRATEASGAAEATCVATDTQGKLAPPPRRGGGILITLGLLAPQNLS